jgi:hypothetical protein
MIDDKPKMFLVPGSLIAATINYLSGKPYAEVAPLIAGLGKASAVEPADLKGKNNGSGV